MPNPTFFKWDFAERLSINLSRVLFIVITQSQIEESPKWLKQPLWRARHSLQSLFSLCVWCRLSSLLLLFLHSCELRNLRMTVICHHLHYSSSVLQMKHLLCCCVSLPACWLLPDLTFDSSASNFSKGKNWWANFVRRLSKTCNNVSLNSLLATSCQNPELLCFATRELLQGNL